MSTQLDQDTLDIINESMSDATDIDGTSAQQFVNELAKRGLCIVSLEDRQRAFDVVITVTGESVTSLDIPLVVWDQVIKP